jgi:hypothetical protein
MYDQNIGFLVVVIDIGIVTLLLYGICWFKRPIARPKNKQEALERGAMAKQSSAEKAAEIQERGRKLAALVSEKGRIVAAIIVAVIGPVLVWLASMYWVPRTHSLQMPQVTYPKNNSIGYVSAIKSVDHEYKIIFRGFWNKADDRYHYYVCVKTRDGRDWSCCGKIHGPDASGEWNMQAVISTLEFPKVFQACIVASHSPTWVTENVHGEALAGLDGFIAQGPIITWTAMPQYEIGENTEDITDANGSLSRRVKSSSGSRRKTKNRSITARFL